MSCARLSTCLRPAASAAGSDGYESPNLWKGARDADQAGQASSDWRAFRAALVAQEAGVAAAADVREAKRGAAEGWVHPISLPERGCLLLARQPDMGPAFTDAVIFLLEHDATSSAGLVLNVPLGLRLRDVGLQDEVAGKFRQQALYRGGPVSDSHLHILHGHPMPEAYEIIDGVYMGGLAQANALVLTGQAAPEDFKLLAGYAGWGSGQLEAEVKQGSWWLVAAAPSVISAAVRGSLLKDVGDKRRSIWQDIMLRAGLAGSATQPYSDYAP
ncbi:hypothetical protein WJX81_002456 [Elliptochloris bilobata]|uniref:Uncharacterized protein n=1 Tax=Elliptochloris bilobata TaxID=381761 RepID=A0AAW1RHS2_9CHLO